MKNRQRILVISNNPFSETSNNGKTLLSFFSSYDEDQIAQLYFKEEKPTSKKFMNYYKLTDKDMLFLNKGNKVQSTNFSSIDDKTNKTKIRKTDTMRVIREIIWKLGPWKNKKLLNWIDDFQPNLIFLCAGDSIFAYRIAFFVQKKWNIDMVVYITDDYILPRSTDSFIGSLRRKYIQKNMIKAVSNSPKYFVISNKMSTVYEKKFDKKGIILNNAQNFLKNERKSIFNENEISLVYAGGLHYKRHEPLIELKKAIERYNKNSRKKAFLYIYSDPSIDLNIVNDLSGEFSSFCGLVNKNDLIAILNNCDIPVFVESFAIESIEATRLSLSTKISEYLSLKKPILALGPASVSSIETLKDVAFCITDYNEVDKRVFEFLENTELQEDLVRKSYEFYQNEFNQENIIKKFRNEMDSIV